ncbi:hypothetical protein [Streptomyces solaniscabiei]|uniref:hypothetical protein n=1 Tax=Streptomyces solaniscabiei TaxID=2683255 RepID=UPI001CE2CB6A|nr:hypothetical protein [Streptomyces solaniscabiei]
MLALHICAVQRPPPNVDPTSLTSLISEALADLVDWGSRAPRPQRLQLITGPSMPD